MSRRFVLLLVLPGVAVSWPVAAQPPDHPSDIPSVSPIQLRQPNGVIRSTPEPVTATVEAARPKQLSLVDLESIALVNHPGLAQAVARVEAARGRWVQAGLYPNPVVGYVGDEMGNEGAAGMHGAMVSQEIVRGNKLGLSRAVVRREIAQAQQEFEVQRYRVLNELRVEFYNVLLAQRAMEISDELLRLNEQALKSVEELFRPGETSRVEVLQAGIEAESARIALDVARNRHTAAWQRLAAAAAVPALAPTPLQGNPTDDLPDLNWEHALGRILSESPELAASRVAVERARWRVRRQQVEPIPNVNLDLGVMHDFASGDDFATVRAAIPLPIHDRNQGGIREAQAEVRVALAETLRLELELQKRLASAFERYLNARSQVQRYSTKILPQAKDSLDLVTTGFRQGEFNYLMVLTAQRTYFQTNLAYLTALRDLRESTIAIEGLLVAGEPRGEMSSATLNQVGAAPGMR